MVTDAGDEIDTSVFILLLKAYWHPLKICGSPDRIPGSRHKGLAQSVLRRPRADVKLRRTIGWRATATAGNYRQPMGFHVL